MKLYIFTLIFIVYLYSVFMDSLIFFTYQIQYILTFFSAFFHVFEHKVHALDLVYFIQVHVGGSVAALGGKLYVSGGYDNTFELSDVVEAYDPTTRSWTLAGRLPQPTFWHGSVSIFRQFMPQVSSAFEPTDIPESNAIHLHRHLRHQALHNLNNNLNQNQNQDVNPAH